MRQEKSDKVPNNMVEKYNEIVELTDSFSKEFLNDEYAEYIRYVIAALCRKRPSPLSRGNANGWACGATHAVGVVNFLFDKDQKPHIGAAELYEKFGIAKSTGQQKSKKIRDLLKMYQMDPNWTLPSRIENNQISWLISVNGLILDARDLSLEVQIQAYEKGLIPYIPNYKE